MGITPSPSTDLDAVVVGAGFSGLYMLKQLTDQGFSVRVFEAGDGVGGAWHWNRYPGARTDSDSMIYAFSEWFDPDLIGQWRWRERYSTQAEIEHYFNWVTEKLDLRQHIDFNTRLASAVFDESGGRWVLTTESGTTTTARFFIPAVGALSEPNIPSLDGLDEFTGMWCHSARFPREGIDFNGKRVVVVGNGATGVQIVPEVARRAASVTHLIRSPYHIVPGRNHVLTNTDIDGGKRDIVDILRYARETFGSFPYDFKGTALETDPETRQAVLEKAWARGGFGFLFVFADVLASTDANETVMQFLREKIKSLVKDPETAATVTPTDPWLTKRPPLDHGYYASLNRENVSVINIKDHPIDRITETSIHLDGGQEIEVDVIVFATGFESYTGALNAIDIRGRDGVALRERWRDRPRNYLGLMSARFPNMFTLYCGAYNPAPFTNGPSLIEQQAEWIRKWIVFLSAEGYETIEPSEAAEEEFFSTHAAIANSTLIPRTASWWTRDTPGHRGESRLVMSWTGGFPAYRRLCDESTPEVNGTSLLQLCR
ncbi:NAD(P)/FAD-dependent oxidoreductase [Hoyosella sp. YIM 151337]|uniref:flavin-containing monooxygenase n=1 Tax=Hoyosella sp. YIM 151337 TaxID=2992742 RepID=UPI002236C0E6|nr:NAD(P)/FAD-dependent oxidoreductase [Hoyosella sp. YIM 151337]MCW4354528.1 NAD(P)/FAD-dependent oxidoreductase [Hoyosella sp. YIM 151337]